MKYLLIVLSFLLIPQLSFSQDGGSDQQLAQYYYSNQEFDKALTYYERLFEQSPTKFNFTRYLECLNQTGDFKTAEKILKKQVSKNKGNIEYEVLLAKFYESSQETDKSNKIYRNLIDDLNPSSRDVIQLYNAFKAQAKNELAFETLQKGRKLLKKSYPLNHYFADYYSGMGQTENMINEYLNLLDHSPSYKSSIQNTLGSKIDFREEESETYDLLRQALLSKSQKNPNEDVYSEMLTWMFIQRENFPAAFVQVRALDKRSKGEGRLLYNLGGICVENKDYSTAEKCFKEVIAQEETTIYSVRSRNALLNVRFLKVTTLRDFTTEELNETIDAYKATIERAGNSQSTLPLILELSHIQAFYGENSLEAIELLSNALKIPSITDFERATVKMELADIHVLHGDIWEAALLYSQIDKDFKYEAIGHEAKFKNARIFYYDAEFEYAQAQLDVLKQSTTKLIANDALKLSLLITDNYGLDSNYIAMRWFANADLLIEQHQYTQAYMCFDSILSTYPGHSLGDEILLKKAHSMKLRGQWNDATKTLEELLKYHGQDILADDALFQLGDIYENHLMNTEKAAEYYRTILFEHKGSLYVTEARKRFKKIRKDPLSEKEETVN
ncbi:MAG: tetratricopeptide repeat protein [Crocinitomicaceae bacterium]|nr:tetratricopeptide repeat protein [Crocinitomicaceae bacterium]